MRDQDVETALGLLKRRDTEIADINKNATKVLYTMTSLSEFNSGQRNTVKGSDRFTQTLIPILTEGVRSMLDFGYEVDVYLICGFEVTEARRQQLVDELPKQVGLEIWDDALPMNYEFKNIKNGKVTPDAALEDHKRGLARQHRFVLKDKLKYYDLFVNFEDDMLIKGEHVQNYLQMTQHLQKLREAAPVSSPESIHVYFGDLTQEQLKRSVPGFMRVEAVLNEALTPIPPLTVKVPVDNTTTIDPSV